jgi:hypothetical protein
MLNQPFRPEMIQSPLHYTQGLAKATQDFQDLILARNVPRVPRSLNPHASEFRVQQAITQASNNAKTVAPQPTRQAWNKTPTAASKNTASFANVTMYDVAYRLERLEAEVEELRSGLHEHVKNCTCRADDKRHRGGMQEMKVAEEKMFQQPAPPKHSQQYNGHAGVGIKVEDSYQQEHPKQYNDRGGLGTMIWDAHQQETPKQLQNSAALGTTVGDSRQTDHDVGSDDLIML